MANEFTWRRVSDSEREEIKRKAKSIMDSFSKELDKINLKELKEPLVEREDYERQEGEGREGDNSFRGAMLENAPNKNDDFIIAEKGSWK